MCFIYLGRRAEAASVRFDVRCDRNPVNPRHSPVFDPQNEVAVFQGTRSMRDDEGGAALHLSLIHI